MRKSPLIRKLSSSLLTIHRAYSAHEFSVHNQHLQRKSSLPLDIKIETILAVLSACVGLVLGTEPLKPISWRTWAGKIEEEGGGSNPYRGLEERMGFLDIRVSDTEAVLALRNKVSSRKTSPLTVIIFVSRQSEKNLLIGFANVIQ